MMSNPSPDSLPGSGTTLLERLLALLRRGGVRSLAEVAQELGTSPALVEAMLEDLARQGYLRPLETQCARECASCAQSCGCAVAGAGRVWGLAAPVLREERRTNDELAEGEAGAWR